MAWGLRFGSPGRRPDFMIRASQWDYANANGPSEHLHPRARLDETSKELTDIQFRNDGTVEVSHETSGDPYNGFSHILDKTVAIAGSVQVFVAVCLVLAAWIIVGVVVGATQNWQIVMQDGQSIQSYLWDTLLMRQQNSAHDNALMCAQLRSRTNTFCRLLETRAPQRPSSDEATKNAWPKEHTCEVTTASPLKTLSTALPERNWFDRLSSRVATILGSVWIIAIYWCGIMAWIGLGALYTPTGDPGPYTGEKTGSNPRTQRFGNNWQMYINTATAVLILICTVFLQNVRARHNKFAITMLQAVLGLEKQIDLHFHNAYHFEEYVTIEIPAQRRLAGEHAIDWYADIMGTGIGVVIAIIVFTVWLGIGHIMKWSSNWWLIIGTYTGLVGFLDGFVLRQVYRRLVQYEEQQYTKVAEDDGRLMKLLKIDCPAEYAGQFKHSGKQSFQLRLSHFIDHACSSRWSVLAAIVCLISLISIATALKWTTTAQLIANTPTMILEEFFLLVLIQAHNWAEVRRRAEISSVYHRRQLILQNLS